MDANYKPPFFSLTMFSIYKQDKQSLGSHFTPDPEKEESLFQFSKFVCVALVKNQYIFKVVKASHKPLAKQEADVRSFN